MLIYDYIRNIALFPKEEHQVILDSMQNIDYASILTHLIHPNQLNLRHSTKGIYLCIIPQQHYESHTTITNIHIYSKHNHCGSLPFNQASDNCHMQIITYLHLSRHSNASTLAVLSSDYNRGSTWNGLKTIDIWFTLLSNTKKVHSESILTTKCECIIRQ